MEQSFNLEPLDDGELLAQQITQQFGGTVTRFAKIGQGFYARVYQVSLDTAPYEVVVKCHLYAGRGIKEQAQLAVLRSHAIVNVPEVYALYPHSPTFPCEALVMEYIPGINASKITFPDACTQAHFVNTVIENLLAWHSVSHPGGFGDLEGPFYASWHTCFVARIADYHALIHQEPYCTKISDHVLNMIDRSFEQAEEIFYDVGRQPVLVHSDYNAWNMMVDPTTCTLTGIIDPIDAGWNDYEIDLFHLPNCRPELGLLERYLQEIEADDRFWMRFKFYRFWDDVKHYVRMGWYDDNRFRTYGRALMEAMENCL
ncbi:MAG: phosphotransferase [Anaerolineae bacterium]|nr:phosphotransferase [Anaerolineae bacterium]